MGGTTIMVIGKSMGKVEAGLGIEEFVADDVLKLDVDELDEWLLRDLEILKLRGTKISERKLVFTLKKGFKAFSPFRLKPVEKPGRFKPIPDKPDKYSTGVKDLNAMLSEGIHQGSIMLLEIDEKMSTFEYHLLAAPKGLLN